MAAYLVCHGTTPPQEVLTCGTAGWPKRPRNPTPGSTGGSSLRQELGVREVGEWGTAAGLGKRARAALVVGAGVVGALAIAAGAYGVLVSLRTREQGPML